MEIMNDKNQLLLLLLISVASLNVKTMAANPSPSASSPAAEPLLSLLNPIPINYFDPTRRTPSGSSSGPSSEAISHVKSICNKTEDPSLCVLTIVPHLNGMSRTDPGSILKTCINVSIRAYQVAVEQLKALSRGPNPPSPHCYERCLEKYEDAIFIFKQALEIFEGADPLDNFVSGRVSAGFHYTVFCQEDFQDSPGTDGLIAHTAGSLVNVSGICVDIAGNNDIENIT